MNLPALLSYTYNTIERHVVCKPEAISDLCDVLDRLRAESAMVICGPTILQHANVVQRVQATLGKRCVGLFSGVLPHAPVEMFEDAIHMAREIRPAALVSVGGGSSHDTAKGLSTVLAQGGRIHDYATRFTPPDAVEFPDFTADKSPVIAVPTTMGAAELSPGAGFADITLGHKVLVVDPWSQPRHILVDGQALATTPVPILRATAMGQFRIAVESVYSTGHNPLGDAMALAAIRMLTQRLPTCSADDIDGLLHIKTAACMASFGNVGGLGLNTAMAHHVGGLYKVPHGDANAILLPHTMRFNLDASVERQVLIAEAMGVDTAAMSQEQAGRAAADAVAGLCRQLGLPERLRDVDVPEDGLARIATATLHDRALATNPRSISDTAPILEVLRNAW
ncbi:MAG: iron-containing alcohol dehydrogenase family protein [bacterium]|nr:iron-containing alcohol dehydrogenase family protein [bacterium]